MANDAYPLGKDAVLYYNTADKKLGDSGVETATLWLADGATTAAGNISSLTVNTESQRTDTNTRASTAGGYASETVVLKSAELTCSTIWNLGDAFLGQAITAWNDNATMAFGALNRDKDTLASGDKLNGFVGNCFVSMSKEEAIDDVQRGSLTITHADSGVFHQVTEP